MTEGMARARARAAMGSAARVEREWREERRRGESLDSIQRERERFYPFFPVLMVGTVRESNVVDDDDDEGFLPVSVLFIDATAFTCATVNNLNA